MVEPRVLRKRRLQVDKAPLAKTREDLAPSVLTNAAPAGTRGTVRTGRRARALGWKAAPAGVRGQQAGGRRGYNVERPLPGLLESRRLELLNPSFAELPGSGCREAVLGPPRALGLALRRGRWWPLGR